MITLNRSDQPTPLSVMEEAFRHYYRPLNLYALHYLQDTDGTEDVVQECLVMLWEKLNAGVVVADPKAYLYKMVRNRCIDRLRQDRPEALGVQPSDLEETLSDEECRERSEMEARLWTAIDKLPEKCREALLLSKRDGLKYQEIARRMGISVNTVENHISKALKLLRAKASDIYYFFFG